MLNDPTFVWRAPLGVLALALLAVRDRWRTGRWDRAREIAFLFGVTGAAMLYALAHDAVTWSISREYFVIGKDLPRATTSFAPVVPLALLAGWSAGLALGLVLIVANNPHPSWQPLSYPALAIEAGRAALWALVGACTLALMAPLVARDAVPLLDEAGVRESTRYLVAQGAHLGSYLGCALGAWRAWRRVRDARRAQSGPSTRP